MQFTAKHHYRACRERMRQARHLYDDGESYALTMYTSGLAVECLRRVFRWKKNPSFEGRHEGKKGNILKASALDLLKAAQGIIDVGVFVWTSEKK